MSINACTLESSTLNVFCSNRRSIVVGRLINELHPPKKTVKGGNPGPVNRWTGFRQEEPVQVPTERPQILVRAWYGSVYGEDLRDYSPMVPFFVFVNDLKFNGMGSVTVNITNLRFNDVEDK